METSAYKQLLRINRGFDTALAGLNKLSKCEGFDRAELRRIRLRVRELRASTNSYLAAVLESAATEEADRLSRRRTRREKAES